MIHRTLPSLLDDTIQAWSNLQCRNIYLKQKKAGGVKITFSSPPKKLDEKMLYNILRDYKMLNCEVLVRDENGKGLTVRFVIVPGKGLTTDCIFCTIDSNGG